MHLKDLKAKAPADLVAMAEELGVEAAGTMRRQDLMFCILRELADDEEYNEEIMGIGTVAFTTGSNVSNRATWKPGAPLGLLTVDSGWPAGAVLEIEIGGTAPGTEFDQLRITGATIFGGTLRVSLVDGYQPQVGDRFLIVFPAVGPASFATIELPEGLTAEVESTASGAELVVTPRPDGPLLVGEPFTIRGADGHTVSKPKAGLCRCGHSKNKPFCDGSHRDAGFTAP